jgi:hypothetical protein
MRKVMGIAICALAVATACRSPIEAPASCEAEIRSPDGPTLEVKFVEVLRIRGCGQAQLRSEVGADLSSLEAVLDRVGVVKVDPLITVARVRLDSLVADARARGETAPDMLSWHRLKLDRYVDAAAAIDQLRTRPEIVYVYQVSETVPPPP